MSVAARPPAVTEYQSHLAGWLRDHHADLTPYRNPVIAPSLEDEVALLQPFQRLLWDEGWLRWGWPEECGGFGGGALLRAAAYETVVESGYPVPHGLLLAEVMVPAIVEFAPALARQVVTPFLRGDEHWCQGFSEPDAGSDLAALRTRAANDGDGFRVRGQKVWSSYGSVSQRCFLLARTGEPGGGHRGLTMFLVDMDEPGISVVPTRAATGRTEFTEIFFDDVPVPRDRLIGDVGQGWAVAMYLLQWERGMYAWQRQSYLHEALGEALASAPDVGDDASWHLGDAYAAMYALRCVCRRTVRTLAAGRSPGASISVDKLLLSATEQTVFDAIRAIRGRQLELGDDPADEALRSEYFYTRSASIYGGSAEIQRNIVADRILGLPREGAGGP